MDRRTFLKVPALSTAPVVVSAEDGREHNVPVVVQVFFERSTKIDNYLFSRKKEWRGLPFWEYNGENSYRWAIDFVVAGEERWIVFGPFNSKESATRAMASAFDGLSATDVSGYRIHNEHCFKYTPGCYQQGNWGEVVHYNSRVPARSAWTDG